MTERTAADIAYRDQVEASVTEHMIQAAVAAHGVAEFYNVLKAEKVPPNLAANLTRRYCDYLWRDDWPEDEA